MSRLWPLVAIRARRDRVQVSLWVISIAAMAGAGYAGVADTFATETERRALLAAAIANPVVLLFRGLPSGASEGAFIAFLILPWLTFLAGLMSTFLAVRHTRMDEERGRAELVGATPAGRVLPLVATMLWGFAANLAVAALTFLVLVATGLSASGSAVLAAATGITGVTFLAVGLIAAQLFRTSRGANTVAVWVVVGSWIVAGIGNALGRPNDDLTRIESSGLTWLSPIGWAENARPFDADSFGPLALSAGVAVIGLAVAFALHRQRDLDASLVPERTGTASAPRGLRTPGALVWRLVRGGVIGWTVGGLIVGMLATTLSGLIAEFGAQNPTVTEMIQRFAAGGSLQAATVTVFFTMLGVLAACCGVQVVARARQEEAHGTAEPVLSAPVGRVRWLADYLRVAMIGIVLVVLAAFAGAAMGIARQGGDWSLMREVIITGAGQALAAAVYVAVTALIFVLVPRATIPLGWSLVLLGLILGVFGPLFTLPDWVVRLSPIAAAPVATADGVDLGGLWWLIAVAAIGAIAALALMRQRELNPDG